MSDSAKRRCSEKRAVCAVCWIDARTGLRGTNETTWICPNCRHAPANVDWVITPPWEVYGVLTVDGELDPDARVVVDANPVEPASPPGPYETERCIEIMRRWCIGESQREIAVATSSDFRHVQRTIAYWRAERGEFLERLLEFLASDGVRQSSLGS